MQLKEAPNVKGVANVSISLMSPVKVDPMVVHMMFRRHLLTLNEDGKFRDVGTELHIRVVVRTVELFLHASVPCFRDLHVQIHPRQVPAVIDK
jgi:hypothetical protein